MKNIRSIIFLAICVSGTADLKDPALAIYHSFDDVKGNVIKDGSTSGNHGEIVGNAKMDKGQIGKAIALKQGVWVLKIYPKPVFSGDLGQPRRFR